MAPHQVPVLGSPTLRLRAHHDDDIARIVEQSRDPATIRWTEVPEPYGIDDAKRFVRHTMPGGWFTDREWGFALEAKGRYAGTVTLRNRGNRRGEITFGAHPDVRGTGVMQAGLRLLLDWGFSRDGRDLAVVEWWAQSGNWASRRTAWRLGFSFDGTVRRALPHRGDLTDGWVGTLLADEPRAPRRPWLAPPVSG